MADTSESDETKARERARQSRTSGKPWLIFAVMALAVLGVITFWSTSERGDIAERTSRSPGPDDSAGIADTDESAEGAETQAAPAAPETATVEGIAASPDAYLGRSVTLRGTVSELHGERSFRLAGEDPRFDETLAVVDIDGTGAELGRDSRIRVRGVVQRFDERELEAALEIELDDEQVRSLAGEPVLVATSVSRLEDSQARAGDD